GYGGCIFCNGGSGYFTDGSLSVTGQLDKEIRRIQNKYGSVPVVAYFQANTNTYAPADRLREIYYSVLERPEVCGISVGTRADCLPEDVLDLLSEVNRKTSLTVELGMQTVHGETIEKINRCCSHGEFLSGYYSLKRRNIRTCVHIINGLPDETPEMMIETARQLAEMCPEAVKIQMLHVIKNTPLEKLYRDGKVSMLSRDEYIDIVVRQLEILPPETVIERITGDGDKSELVAPLWSTDKISVLGGIDKRLAELDSWQGKYYVKSNLVKSYDSIISVRHSE
ncbi:MAG: TIGR01212 family radical SAM protein, partial [Ruminococcus sp.]|nr:TIGR01212 family radical SAM protein [Ruminococcus sp.]